MTDKQRLITALKEHYHTDVLSAKGGFFVRDIGFIPLSKARKITGIKSTAKRTPRGKSTGYGDYAILCKLVGRI